MDTLDEPSRRDPLGTAFKVFLAAAALLGLGYCAWCLSLPEGGVRLSNQMDAYAEEYLEEHGLLEEGEEVVAYYDATIHMSGTEAAILTDQRVLYHKDPRTTAIPLAGIAELRHRSEPLIGDVIEVIAADGRQMQIEIAPLNNGVTFWNALRRAAPADARVEDEDAANAAVPSPKPAPGGAEEPKARP